MQRGDRITVSNVTIHEYAGIDMGYCMCVSVYVYISLREPTTYILVLG